MSECRSCSAPIVWVKTEKGRAMPIDAAATPDGRFRKERVDENGDKIVHFVRDNEMADNTARLYSSHFATCPNAKEHRK